MILVILVLLQSGKEGMGVIFGGGSSSLFGSSGAGGLLGRLTAIMATIFLCTSLGYTYLTGHHGAKTEESVMDVQLEEKAPQQTPAAPAGVTIESKPDVDGKPAAEKSVAAQPGTAPVPVETPATPANNTQGTAQ